MGGTTDQDGNAWPALNPAYAALKKGFGIEFQFLDYHEHAVGRAAASTRARARGGTVGR